MAGDMIRMIEIKQNRVHSLFEGIILEVTTEKNGQNVVFYPINDKVLRFPTAKSKEAPKEDPLPEFISGPGAVEWNLGKRAYVISVNGKPVCEIENKDEAHAVARGDKPIPVTA